MRMSWIAVMIAGLFTISATVQTSVGSSASGGASVTPGQAAAGANASQSAQTSGTSTNVDGSANARVPESNANKGTEKGSAELSSGTTLQAELTKSIDAKKAKSGDEVAAKLTQDVKADGKVVMHKGIKLVGHVTEAQAWSKENAESKLGIVFDKAVLKGGQKMAFSGVIQALAPPVQGTLSATGDEGGNLGSGMGSGSGNSMGGGRSSGGSLAPIGGVGGGAPSTLGSATSTAGNTAGSVTNSATGAVNGSVKQTTAAAANGTFNSATRGVVGMQGLALNTAAAGSAQGSVISSTSRNVKLDSGTQMILQVAGSAAAK